MGCQMCQKHLKVLYLYITLQYVNTTLIYTYICLIYTSKWARFARSPAACDSDIFHYIFNCLHIHNIMSV